MCVKERGLRELGGGGLFFGDLYGCWGWGKFLLCHVR